MAKNKDQLFVEKLCAMTKDNRLSWVDGGGDCYLADHGAMLIQLLLDKNNQATLMIDGYLDVTERDIESDGSLTELRDAVLSNVRAQQPSTLPPDREQDLEEYIKRLDS